MKVSAILENPSVKILLFLYESSEVRYINLTDLIASRGTLSKNLKELEEDNLIKRRVVTTRPIQSYYSLTEKGMKIAKRMSEIKRIISG